MENQPEMKTETKNLELENDGLNYLKETRMWTNFLSILGFVFLGLMLLMFLVVIAVPKSGILGNFEAMMFIPMLLLIAVYFFPIYYLFMFSKHSKQALMNSDKSLMTVALKYLKMHYRFMGILVIVIFSIYLIVFLIALAAGSFFNIFS